MARFVFRFVLGLFFGRSIIFNNFVGFVFGLFSVCFSSAPLFSITSPLCFFKMGFFCLIACKTAFCAAVSGRLRSSFVACRSQSVPQPLLHARAQPRVCCAMTAFKRVVVAGDSDMGRRGENQVPRSGKSGNRKPPCGKARVTTTV